MPTHTVTKADTSKGGAPRVYFDNKHDWKDAYYVSKKIEAPLVGQSIDANTASSDYQGKTYWYLNGWKPAGQPEAPTTVQVSSTRLLPSKGWNLDSKDRAIILEVVLKAAFDKGLIGIPEEMAPWFERTYRYVEGVSNGKPIALDEPLPDFGVKVGVDGPIDESGPSF
jgi:hypothetical protein